MYLDVSYGSNVTILHDSYKGGYLHSHLFDYPSGSKQQQVTTYPGRDENNVWVILPAYGKFKGSYKENEAQIRNTYERIKNGDTITLMHFKSGRKLHSHDIRGPVTVDKEWSEVSGYGHEKSIGDANDNWRIEFVSDSQDDPYLKAFTTRFHLVHVFSKRKLFSHFTKLPEWGLIQILLLFSDSSQINQDLVKEKY